MNPARSPRLLRAMEPWGFLPAAALVVAFGALFTESARLSFRALQSGIVEHFGWFYILTASTLLGFIVWLLISPLRSDPSGETGGSSRIRLPYLVQHAHERRHGDRHRLLRGG